MVRGIVNTWIQFRNLELKRVEERGNLTKEGRDSSAGVTTARDCVERMERSVEVPSVVDLGKGCESKARARLDGEPKRMPFWLLRGPSSIAASIRFSTRVETASAGLMVVPTYANKDEHIQGMSSYKQLQSGKNRERGQREARERPEREYRGPD